MKVGVIGYYGWGNYGDEMFLETLRDALAGHDIVLLHDWQTGRLRTDVDELIAGLDAVVIGGGDLLIPGGIPSYYWDARLLRKPVVVFGVGAATEQAPVSKALELYSSFLRHPSVRWISARDEESRGWIGKVVGADVPVEIYPDMVFASRFPILPRDPSAVGLVLRHHPEESLPAVEALAAYIMQTGLRLQPIVLAIGSTRRDDILAYETSVPAVPWAAAGSLVALSKALAACSVVLSMKFHGCVAAYAMGIPSLAMSRSAKFINLMRLTGNPWAAVRYDQDLRPAFDRLVRGDFVFARRSDLCETAERGLLRLRSVLEAL